MSDTLSFPIRKECPPGACVCGRETLLRAPHSDLRVLKLTREEEKKLIERIEALSSYADLQKLGQRMQELLGVTLRIAPRSSEVRSVLGLSVQLLERPGLCAKTRKTVPAAIRRCLEKNPHIIYAILDAHDLFGQG